MIRISPKLRSYKSLVFFSETRLTTSTGKEGCFAAWKKIFWSISFPMNKVGVQSFPGIIEDRGPI